MSLVLVDSSAWIEFFRKMDSPYAEAIDVLLEENRVCTCDLVMAEIVPAARSRKQFDELLDYFQALPRLDEPADLWPQIMEAAFSLRRNGINGVGIPDLMIAIIARSHKLPVLSKDRHFATMHTHLGLDLYKDFVG